MEALRRPDILRVGQVVSRLFDMVNRYGISDRRFSAACLIKELEQTGSKVKIIGIRLSRSVVSNEAEQASWSRIRKKRENLFDFSRQI
jgi:hypothetical protein